MSLHIKDASRMLKLSEKEIYRYLRQKDMPHYVLDGRILFNRADLLEWASGRQQFFHPDLFLNGSLQTSSELLEAMKLGTVVYDLPGKSRDEALAGVAKSIPISQDIDADQVLEILVARENLGTTAIGHGIAIPHVRHPLVTESSLSSISLFFLKHPLDFNGPDGQAVDTLFTLISPTVEAHLRLLAKLGIVLRDAGFRESLKLRPPPDELFKAMSAAETAALSKPSKGVAEET